MAPGETARSGPDDDVKRKLVRRSEVRREKVEVKIREK
jgi:hypothetical protein